MIDKTINLTNQEILEIVRDVVDDFSKTDPEATELFKFAISMNDGINSKALDDKIGEFLRVVLERGMR